MSYATKLANVPTPDLFPITKRTVIVSGGGRGLGLGGVLGCLEAGSCVAAIDLLPTPTEPEWSQAQAVASAKGLTLTYYPLDVSDPAAVSSVFKTIFSTAPASAPVRGMFLSAGVPSSKTVLEESFEYWRKVYDVNVGGLFLCCQAFAKEWLGQNPTLDGSAGTGGASIVLVASVAGYVANRDIPCSAYATSKASVIHMAKCFAAEWGTKGIRVNSLSPGYIKTVMTDGINKIKPGYEEALINHSLLGRPSFPDEYRGPVVFLLSDASSFITGTDLVVDGGHRA